VARGTGNVETSNCGARAAAAIRAATILRFAPVRFFGRPSQLRFSSFPEMDGHPLAVPMLFPGAAVARRLRYGSGAGRYWWLLAERATFLVRRSACCDSETPGLARMDCEDQVLKGTTNTIRRVRHYNCPKAPRVADSASRFFLKQRAESGDSYCAMDREEKLAGDFERASASGGCGCSTIRRGAWR